jgi:hypothetical protein
MESKGSGRIWREEVETTKSAGLVGQGEKNVAPGTRVASRKLGLKQVPDRLKLSCKCSCAVESSGRNPGLLWLATRPQMVGEEGIVSFAVDGMVKVIIDAKGVCRRHRRR